MHLDLMRWLKQSKAPQVADLRPKICLTCWEIFSRETELYHSDVSSHKTTNEFAKMHEADAQVLIKLAKSNGRCEDGSDCVQLFKLDPKIA